MPEQPKIAILGPRGSYNEIAALRYLAEQNLAAEIVPCPNIIKAFAAIGSSCDYGIIPIENMVEGYVPLSLDLLADSTLQIIGEIVIPVNFSFVANCDSLDQVGKVYVQFVTEGQCRNFLGSLPDQTKFITTESNSASFAEACRHQPGEGAVIPDHLLDRENFPLTIPLVNDRQGNRTRFIVLAPQRVTSIHRGEYRTSIVIRELEDAPGALYAIIGAFAQRNINLSCIMSRPNKVQLGRYFFFIDIDAPYPENSGLVAALSEIAQTNEVKILGSYPVATSLTT